MFFSPDFMNLGSTFMLLVNGCLLLTHMFPKCADNASSFEKLLQKGGVVVVVVCLMSSLTTTYD